MRAIDTDLAIDFMAVSSYGNGTKSSGTVRVIELAVKGMLPKGPLGRSMIKKLHVYAGPEHNHAAQKPEVLTF